MIRDIQHTQPLPRIEVNGRTYGSVAGPVVVVCVDGDEPAYHEEAIAAGRMPFLSTLLTRGTSLRAESAMPSFTNPNNLSIATGVPPAVHGICGNYFLDRESRREVMMNDPELLWAPTILAAYARRGVRVAVITAKDKLRRLLGAGLSGGICFSAEYADQADLETAGIEDVPKLVGMAPPPVYSADLSRFVLAAGVEVMRRYRPGVMYLSLTDYIQHKHPPGSPVADDFYAMLDQYYAELDALGCLLVLTADHGMNAKTDPDGRPAVIYLQQELDDWLGPDTARVVLPITDPYVVHHGALGSYASVHLDPALASDESRLGGLAARLAALPGVELAIAAAEACARFELPPDRTGDIVVIGDRHTALGTTAGRHDLSELDAPLRSHGGLAEQSVPFIVNRPIADLPAGHRLRNYDAYWVACNQTVQS
ncbi:MAG TPA: phosphonoacetate hydrolase [Actinopolymorphaceae bacterium]